jgi:hypothetical protein
MPQEVKKVSKKCPEGKVLNPKTGRCIKNGNLDGSDNSKYS